MSYVGGRLEPLFTPELAEEAAHDMAVDGTVWLHHKIVENTPVSYHGIALGHQGFGHERPRAPGTLKRSWYLDPDGVHRRRRGADYAYIGQVKTDDPIAPFVENDTRPHIIRPKNPNGFLRFRLWPSGQLVFAKMVRHPGTTGHHMVLLSENAARVNFAHIVGRRLRLWAVQQARHCMRVNRQA